MTGSQAATSPATRLAGWLGAGVMATGLVGGAAAFALSVERRAEVLYLDLALAPPSAPSLAAVAEAAPVTSSVAPAALDAPAEADVAPPLPRSATASDMIPSRAIASPMRLPAMETPFVADLAMQPPKVEPDLTPDPVANPKTRPRPRPTPTAKAEPSPEGAKVKSGQVPVAKATAPAEPAPPASAARASAPEAKAKGGSLSPATYAKAVLKKVRSTRKAASVGKGKVVVGFTVAPDGGLATIKVLKSSGNATLDKVAMDHIRRSLPFPTPPADLEQRSYSFEFVGG